MQTRSHVRRGLWSVAAFSAILPSLAAQGLRGPQVCVPGGTIEVVVAGGDVEVEVSTGGPPTPYPVGQDKKAYIPVPDVPVGTVILVSIGKGLGREVLILEVVDP